jgi:hypothetical protein
VGVSTAKPGFASGLSGALAATLSGLSFWTGGVPIAVVTTGVVTASALARGDSTATGTPAFCCESSKLITKMTAANVNPPTIKRERLCESITHNVDF